MAGWWVSDILHDPARGAPWLVSWVIWVIGSIVLHELAHGWAAIRLGDDTPIQTGHMTWNPLVHMGMFSLFVFAIVGIAWGAMPVDPSRLRGRHGDALVSVAGPAMNIALAIVSVVCLAFWQSYAPQLGVADPLLKNLTNFFWLGALLNIVLAIFNMMPIMPLDGGRILAHYWDDYARFAMGENGRWVMLGGFLLVFWFAIDPIVFTAGIVVAVAEGALTLVLP